jgi:hypothetical protein
MYEYRNFIDMKVHIHLPLRPLSHKLTNIPMAYSVSLRPLLNKCYLFMKLLIKCELFPF